MLPFRPIIAVCISLITVPSQLKRHRRRHQVRPGVGQVGCGALLVARSQLRRDEVVGGWAVDVDGWLLPGAVAPPLRRRTSYPCTNPGETLVDAHLGRLSRWTNSEESSISEQQEVAR